MSVRSGLLALLSERPMYGYELRGEFESRTGGTWPLNIGQVYTTLARLERDGLVEPLGEDDAGRALHGITDAGREELAAWFGSPVGRDDRPRDELAIKIAMAVTVPGVDVRSVLQAQRRDTLEALRDFTRLKARAADGDVAWLLVLEAHVFKAEAEVRWLDHCEAALVRHASARPARSRATTPATGPAGTARTATRSAEEATR